MKGCTGYAQNIQFYVDGELAAWEKDELLSHLANCPSCSHAMQEAEFFSSRIRAARPLLTAPDSLRTAVLRQVQQAEEAKNVLSFARRNTLDRHLRFLIATAAALVLVIGGLLAVPENHTSQTSYAIQTAILAHQELERHALPLDISSQSSRQVSSWFQSRVSFPFHMADAGIASDSTARYKLAGGRLLSMNRESVALVVFTLPDGLVTMLVCPSHLMEARGGAVVDSGGIILHSYDQGPMHIVTWNDRSLGYVLVHTSGSMTASRKCTSCHAQNATDTTLGMPLIHNM